ncbi:ribulose-phosphate 3-epimerase [Pedobacter heparinus]|uniref:Ribulose-phosphate 3-epimerase n=1 Tax=Pedobacter heparinus (strain ATCC 13125 / DSM 2366 / CIP 104194 / JCM 7457 / NBRC 12017 / NCIMB 9290 / NRRL B-14731 / HIM 762-3) TaxID=485917 RepID=C6XVJ7_PEDHD|nr:ribulose-phosphate 3-epimerase [Pedobacter heparinus]ACU04063.1 ribulose-phosphate 3-epimerase [Pedobacter heparinus DSM 2366]
MSHLIAPSVLSADFANLQRDIEMINASAADWFHVDIMDGVFVPNISFGFPVMEAIKRYAEKPLDVHLMIVNPDQYIERFAAAGAAMITVHYEACTHLHRTVQAIHATGCRAGVALNPHTPVSMLKDLLTDLDMVLIMSVNPGFGGQQFIPNSLNKIAELRKMASAVNPDLLIEVDGGVGLHNTAALLQAGADVLVAGNAIFAAASPAGMIAELKQIEGGLVQRA